MEFSGEITISLLIAIGGIISTYAVTRHRVATMEERIKAHEKESNDTKDKIDRKLDAGFKRLDLVQERIVVLERDTATHLDMPKAEEKFVSKVELELHLKNIELTTTNTNKSVASMEGKLNDLVELLRTNIVDTLSLRNRIESK